MSHDYFMKKALAIAQQAMNEGELPIGAVIVCNEKIVASSSTKEKAFGRWLVHAELLALEEADKMKPYPGKRRESRIYTTLEPCMMCLGACMSFNIGEIYFALESPGDGAVDLVRSWNRKNSDMPSYKTPNIQGGLLRQESIELFKQYTLMNSSGGLWDWAKTLAAL
jgi:tRNA(adenine34) deaminase